ncbi:FK506 binding protein [Aureococcus anophagefferens]|nr:FK506 binding protein [Aureococcus anophagefferens]
MLGLPGMMGMGGMMGRGRARGLRGRRPDVGDECVVTWTEKQSTGKAAAPREESKEAQSDDDDAGDAAPARDINGGSRAPVDDAGSFLVSSSGKPRAIVIGDLEDESVPPGLHDAIPTMIKGEKVSLTLDKGKQSKRCVGATTCECELVAVMPVDDCTKFKERTVLKKTLKPSSELDEVQLLLRKNVSWKVGDPGARRQDDDVVVESERFNGILGDLRPSQLQLAICRMALKEEALVRVGDEKEHTVWSVVVESFQPVTDCSGEAQDGSVLKKEVKEGDGWDMPTDEFDVSLSVTSAKWLSGAGRALGDVEGLSPAPREVPEVPEGQDPVYPELVHVSTLDPPLRLACRAMKKGEVGHVTASVGSFTKGGSTGVANLPEGDAKAVAKIKLVLHSWRDNEKLTDCGTVLKKTTTEGGDDSRKAQQLDGVTVHFLNLELGLGKEDGADPEAEQKWEPVENFAPFTVDWTIDETDAACPGLEEGATAMKVAEVAEVTVKQGGRDGEQGYPAEGFDFSLEGRSHFSACAGRDVRATLRLDDIRRLPPSYELESIPKLARAEELKAKGNYCFAGRRNVDRAVRRYGGAIDCITSCSEKDLSDAQNAQKAGLNVSLHNNRAQCYIIQEEWQKGKGDCDRALEGDPTNVKALFRRGHCCFHLDDWFEAKKNFKRCLELDPKCREAHKGLVTIAARAKEQNAKDKGKFDGYKLAQAIKSDKPDIAPKPDPDEAVDAAENGQEDGDKDGCVEPAAGGKLKIAAAAAALLAGGALCAWFFLKDE